MEDAAVSMLSYDKMNVFDKPNEQNGACINSAMARKGGCEETKFFHSQLQSVPQHACLYQKGLHLGYMITSCYYYLLSMQKVGENNHEEPNFNRAEPKTNCVGTHPFLATNFLKSAFLDFISTLGLLRSALCGFVESQKNVTKMFCENGKTA